MPRSASVPAYRRTVRSSTAEPGGEVADGHPAVRLEQFEHREHAGGGMGHAASLSVIPGGSCPVLTPTVVVPHEHIRPGSRHVDRRVGVAGRDRGAARRGPRRLPADPDRGRRPRPTAGPGVDLDTHIEDIVRLVEVEDLRDVVLVGHSYGGMPVSAAALRLRDRIKHGGVRGQRPAAGGQSPGATCPADEAGAGRPATPVSAPRAVGSGGRPGDAGRAGRGRAGAAAGAGHRRTRWLGAAAARRRGRPRPTADHADRLHLRAGRRSSEMMAAGHPFFAGLTEARIVPICPPGTGRC